MRNGAQRKQERWLRIQNAVALQQFGNSSVSKPDAQLISEEPSSRRNRRQARVVPAGGGARWLVGLAPIAAVGTQVRFGTVVQPVNRAWLKSAPLAPAAKRFFGTDASSFRNGGLGAAAQPLGARPYGEDSHRHRSDCSCHSRTDCGLA